MIGVVERGEASEQDRTIGTVKSKRREIVWFRFRKVREKEKEKKRGKEERE